MVVALPALKAADVTWTTGTSNGLWATGDSWLGGIAPTTADSVFFGATTGTTSLTYNIANTTPGWGGITFASGASAYTISGGTMTMAGGTATITNSSTNTQIINSVFASGFTVAGSGSLTLGGRIASGSITKNGTGVLTLTGSNSIGTLTANSGTVAFGATVAAGTTTSIVMNGGNIRFTAGTGPTFPSLAMQQSGTISIGIANFNAIGVVNLSGTGALTLSGENGTNGVFQRGISLTGTSNPGFSGTILVANQSYLQITNENALGTSADALSFDGGRLVTAATMSINNKSIAVASGGLLLAPNAGGTLTLGGGLAGTGQLTLRPNNNGLATIALGGTNSFTGAVNFNPNGGVEAVTLRVLSDTALNSNPIDFRPQTTGIATLDINGRNITVGGVRVRTDISGIAANSFIDNTAAQSGTLTLGGGNATASFAGTIRNTGASLSLTKIGTGTQTLTGSNSYTGSTRISAGGLGLGSVNALAGSTLDMNAADAGSLAFTVTGTNTYNLGGLIGSRAIATSGSVVLSIGANATSGTYSGVVSGGGGFTKVGAGTLTLTGNNTYSGLTTISGGTLAVGNGGTSGAVAGNVLNNAALVFNRSDATTFANAISGSGFVRLLSGSLTLSGSNSFSGGTSIDGGTLLVNGSLASGVAAAANTMLGGSGVIAGTLSGAGLVSPGNSPGILTADAFDSTGGLDAAFEFTAFAPNYGVSGTGALNDVLRLTNATPFVGGGLGAGNVIDIYFNVNSIANGDIFEGGFFTSHSAAELLTNVESATFRYWIKDDNGGTPFGGVNYSSLASLPGITGMTVNTVSRTADFGGGDVVTGSVTQFIVVPEPGAIALAGIGVAMAGWSLYKRRRTAGRFGDSRRA